MIISLRSIAEALDVDLTDVQLVADVELQQNDYDPETGLVTERGRQALVQHFRGGADP